mgnify:FL=1
MYLDFVVSILMGFALVALAMPFAIPELHKLKFGQTILDIGPKWHKNKQGTPTMGGLMFIAGVPLGVLLSILVSLPVKFESVQKAVVNELRVLPLVAGILMALAMAAIGCMDDYIKVVQKRNLGLTAKQKTFLQLIVAAAYLLTLRLGGMTFTRIPFVGTVDISHGFGLVFWPIALMFIYGFTNAVNLTDGIDGLAASVTAVVGVFFAVFVMFKTGYILTEIAAVSLVGGCAGFLIWNRHPAKVFMGDTGSMFLGGMVVALSFMIESPIILLLAGIVYLGEAMSVVIQVSHYKRTKKRIFKMTPIHHHFELSGWSENKIVAVFSLVAAIGCFVGEFLYLNV